MKVKKHWLLVVVAICCAIVFVCMTKADVEKQNEKYSTTVQLDVSAKGDIQNTIYSYISRELRSLGDVKLVENDPEYIISVTAIERTYVSGTKSGDIAISMVATEPLTFYKTFKDRVNEIQYKELEGYCKGEAALVCTQLALGRTSQLQSTCQGLVVDFDVEVLEPSRKFHQRLQEVTKKVRQQFGLTP